MRNILIYCLAVLFLASCGNSSTQRKGGNKPSENSEMTAVTASKIKPVVNVYVENSASMAGYVNGNTDFKKAVYNYLTDIKISGITDTLNLFYINDKPVAKGSDVEDFIEKLNPNQCVFATSDISNVFDLVLKRTDNKQISVLITDGIFSPGRGKDAEQYLVNQQIGIKTSMAEYLKVFPNTAVIVYQLSSNFKGRFFNREDKSENIDASRPYYIWVIGDVANIASLKAHIPDERFKGGGVQHSYTLLPPVNMKIDYAILSSPKQGSFNRQTSSGSGCSRKKDIVNPKTSIYNIKKASNGAHKGNFMFTIGMDLSLFTVLLGDEYLTNTESYARLINKQPNNDYFIEIEHNTNPNTNYTHNMKLTTDKISVGELEIILRNQFPQWIYDINDEEGLDIYKNDAINKTFGIKYLAEGIYEAYNFSGNSIYTTMKFNLKK